MAIFKWIIGLVGYIAFGPLGGLAGLVLGSLFEGMTDADGGNAFNPGGSSTGYSDDGRVNIGQRNSFLFSLLVLASYIIKSDNKVMHSEMEFVRQFLRRNFGAEAEQQGNDILLRLFEQMNKQGGPTSYSWRNTIYDCCGQIASNTDYSTRLQLLNFLVLIAQADGVVTDEETKALYEVAEHLGLSRDDIDSMLHLEGGSLDDAYKVLGISADATNDEVKAAYRKMALKHHPDRVASLGDDVRKAAEKKFQEINAAKEKIYKARGMS